MEINDILATLWIGKPAWLWLSFIAIIFTLLVLDLGLFHKKAHAPRLRESIGYSIFYILVAVAFGCYVWFSMGEEKGMEYFTAYAMEKSLSLDNIFVISLIFAALSIPRQYQHRILFYGILGVLLLRGIMIGLGAALITEFQWILIIFGFFLLVTGIKMLVMEEKEHSLEDNKLLKLMRNHMLITDELHGQRFFVKDKNPKTGRMALWATPLFIALVLVEFADLVFAVDSVPAVFAVTQDTFIVYTSNIFAILGLRALYFTLEAMVHRFAYLSKALALVLVFIGGKLLATEFLHVKMPIEISLAVVITLILSGIVISLMVTAKQAKQK